MENLFKYATNSNEMGDEEKNWKKSIHALESLLVCLKEILKVKNWKIILEITLLNELYIF